MWLLLRQGEPEGRAGRGVRGEGQRESHLAPHLRPAVQAEQGRPASSPTPAGPWPGGRRAPGNGCGAGPPGSRPPSPPWSRPRWRPGRCAWPWPPGARACASGPVQRSRTSAQRPPPRASPDRAHRPPLPPLVAHGGAGAVHLHLRPAGVRHVPHPQGRVLRRERHPPPGLRLHLDRLPAGHGERVEGLRHRAPPCGPGRPAWPPPRSGSSRTAGWRRGPRPPRWSGRPGAPPATGRAPSGRRLPSARASASTRRRRSSTAAARPAAHAQAQQRHLARQGVDGPRQRLQGGHGGAVGGERLPRRRSTARSCPPRGQGAVVPHLPQPRLPRRGGVPPGQGGGEVRRGAQRPSVRSSPISGGPPSRRCAAGAGSTAPRRGRAATPPTAPAPAPAS